MKALSVIYSDRAVARQTPVAQNSLSLSFYEEFLGKLAWRKSNAKFRITFRYLNMYVSTQKFPQIFLYMSTRCCESFKSFGEVGKKFFISNFYDSEISSPAKNRF